MTVSAMQATLRDVMDAHTDCCGRSGSVSVRQENARALRSDARYLAARPDDRARYIRDVREVAEAAGFAWAFWNYFDGMGLTIDDASHAFDPAITAALGLRLPDGTGAQDRR